MVSELIRTIAYVIFLCADESVNGSNGLNYSADDEEVFNYRTVEINGYFCFCVKTLLHSSHLLLNDCFDLWEQPMIVHVWYALIINLYYHWKHFIEFISNYRNIALLASKRSSRAKMSQKQLNFNIMERSLVPVALLYLGTLITYFYKSLMVGCTIKE